MSFLCYGIMKSFIQRDRLHTVSTWVEDMILLTHFVFSLRLFCRNISTTKK